MRQNPRVSDLFRPRLGRALPTMCPCNDPTMKAQFRPRPAVICVTIPRMGTHNGYVVNESGLIGRKKTYAPVGLVSERARVELEGCEALGGF